jgi:hypothetical protein
MKIIEAVFPRVLVHNIIYHLLGWGTRYQGWLRHYATCRKVAGSIPEWDYWTFPSSRYMGLGSTQHLTEMSTINLPGGKLAAGKYGWQPHRDLWADFLQNVGASTSHNPKGLHSLWSGSIFFSSYHISSTEVTGGVCMINDNSYWKDC